MWTIGLTIALFGATYVFYTREVAASYGLGALGGYLYLRLLNKTVDGFGGAGGSGGPRLAIPVVLVLGFNRFNELKADEVGLPVCKALEALCFVACCCRSWRHDKMHSVV